MRNIINISLPEKLTSIVEENVKKGNFSSKSEFFRMLIRLWMQRELLQELEESRKELGQGKGQLLKSLKELR